MAPKLEVTRGKDVGAVHKLRMLTRIGRELDNTIVLTDTKASRHHAEISLEQGQWVIRDLGSYNKTYINDNELTDPIALFDGDRVSIGETEFTLRMPVRPEAETAPMPAPASQANVATAPMSAPTPSAPPPRQTKKASIFPWIVGAIFLLLLVAIGIIGFTILNQPVTPADPIAADDEPIAPITDTLNSDDTPAEIPENLVVAYEEDFSDSFSGWDDAFDAYTRKVYGNNRYQIEVTTENLVAWGLANRDVADFEVEVEALVEDGGIDNSHGLLFRFQDPENFYRFDISGDGYFLLSKYLDGSWITLQDWTPSEFIMLDNPNLLKISAFGSTITAWVNGKQIATITDDSLTHGNFGFFAGTFADPYVWVSFDDLNIKLAADNQAELVMIPTATPPFALLVDSPAETATLPPTTTPTATAPPAETVAAATTTIEETPTATPTSTTPPTPTITPTPIPLPEYASRAQPLARGQRQISGRLIFPIFDNDRSLYDIYMANIADGSELTLLQEQASQPAISADGADFAYRSWQPDRRGLFARPFAGGDAWHFSTFFEDSSPRFATGSKTLLYHSRTGGPEPAIYWVVDGVGQVMRRDGAPIQGELADWLPNGEQFVYKSCIGGTCGIMFGDIVGSGGTLLTDEVTDTNPQVSPDGSAIAFMSKRDGNWNIYRMDIDGSNLTALTDNEADEGLPTWSPDGQEIAFASNRDGEWAIWDMQADGSNERQLFTIDGSIDGIIAHDPNNSRGWADETMIWIE